MASGKGGGYFCPKVALVLKKGVTLTRSNMAFNGKNLRFVIPHPAGRIIRRAWDIKALR